MRRATRWATLALLVGVIACANGDGSDVEPAATGMAADTLAGTASPLRGALPGLFSIMLGLQGQMERVARGIWLEDYGLVAEGAQAVADHPTVPPEELAQVSAVLGDDVGGFGAGDTKVHDLAVVLAERARAADMAGVVSADADLRAACAECHTMFRARLRQGIAGGEASAGP